jgi:hypothetical protein
MYSVLGCVLIFLFSLTSCSNQFAYKENDWVQITQSGSGINSKTVYADKNRSTCENGICKVWTKIEFFSDEAIPFEPNKQGSEPGAYLAKRIDSMVWYYCDTGESKLISYQLYDRDGKLVESQWLNQPVLSQIAANTVDADIFKYFCKTSLK